MSGSAPAYCGDCGAPAVPVEGDLLKRTTIEHFPGCLSLREKAAGVEVRTTFSNGGRECPRCKSEMTRNHDQQTDTWTWNCTGAMCGVTMDALPPPPELADVEQVEVRRAFEDIAAQPGAVVLEVDDDGTMRAPPGLIPPSPEAALVPTGIEWVWVVKADLERLKRSEELLKEAGLLLFNAPSTTDTDWVQRATKVLWRIHEVLPGGIP